MCCVVRFTIITAGLSGEAERDGLRCFVSCDRHDVSILITASGTLTVDTYLPRLTLAHAGSSWLVLACVGSQRAVSQLISGHRATYPAASILNRDVHHILCSGVRVRRSLRSVDRRSHRRRPAAAARDHSATNWEPVLPAVRAGPPMGSRAGRRSIGRSFELWADFGRRLSGYLVISDRWTVGWWWSVVGQG